MKTNWYMISFPGYRMITTQLCESTGKETIHNFVKRIFRMPGNGRFKPHLEKMVFINGNGECINVGLPVGVLSTEETYQCCFKRNLTFYPSDLCRHYAVDKYSSDWNLSYFLVLCSEGKIAPGVSQFSKIASTNTKIKVDFFNDETIFEALVRDNRFKEEKLRSCGVTFDRTQIPLSCKAVHIQGKDVEIVSLNEKDRKLPESVSLRPHPKPTVTAASILPKQIKQEHASVTCLASFLTQWPVDSSTPLTARPSFKTRDNSAPLAEVAFDIECKTLTLGKNARGLVKRRIKKLKNFALKQDRRSYVSELKDLNEIAQSVGAIFILDHADHRHFVGTCFRIGTEYIITNKHVMEEITKIGKDRVYVNFNFNKAGEADSKRSFIDSVVICSAELDYAILRMEKPHEQLPPCIFSYGISIMNPTLLESNWSVLEDKPLRLIGHPEGEPKQIDLMCTLNARPQSGLECWCYTLRKGKEFEAEAANHYHECKYRRRRTYQTTNSFLGSSGSPGIVLLNDKKLLVVLQTRGFKDNEGNFFIEQGVLLTEIFKDVQEQINEAQQDPLKNISVEDLFPSVDCSFQPLR